MSAVRPVVLAGGNGVRLWPVSRSSHPKPYLPLLNGGESPFQAAVRAAAEWGPPLVIGRHAHRFLAAEQLAALGLDATLLLEPEPRGGGAAIALAACLVEATDRLLILPSEPPGPLPADFGADWVVGRDEGRAVWDGVRAQTVREALVSLLGPVALAAVERAARTEPDLDFQRVCEEAWDRVPHLDAELLRRVAKAQDVPAAAGQHIGDWAAVHRSIPADEAQNVLIGDAVALGSRRCLVHAAERLVAVVDMEDIAVVETADAVLVAPREAAERVRELVSTLEAQDRVETQAPQRVLRPWGAYEPIGRGPRWLAKRIVVKPGEALSLQRHTHRAEHWIVVSGQACVRRGDEEFVLGVDASTYIPRGTVHRLENRGSEPLVLVEVQTGDRLDEDDIERLEDRYGRGSG